jgi:hypothetical protein
MGGTSNSYRDKWKEKNILESGEEKEMQKQQTNKEQKKWERKLMIFIFL